MLINLSNHPSTKWSKKQMQAAKASYGEVLDMPFPAVKPTADKEEVLRLAKDYFYRIVVTLDQCANQPRPHAVHIQGEFTFVCQLVSLLKSSKIKCIASTSVRNVIEKEGGEKIVKFDFIQFREY